MRYTITLTPDDGQISVRVPAMPGVFTWGATDAEALTSAREAIELHLEGYVERGLPLPPDRRSIPRGRTTRLVTIEVAAPERQTA
jgi:predicted RNase H-like HicB family nuclease